MQRLWVVCALLITTVTAGSALAASSAQSRATHVAPARLASRAEASATSAASQRFLFGARSVARHVDSVSAGRVRSFAFKNRAHGVVRGLRIYVGSRSRASKVIVGLYSNRRGHPGTLLARGSVKKPRRKAWNRIAVKSTAIHAGWTYWLAVLGRGGRLTFRDRSGKRCMSTTSRKSFATLPSSWKTGRRSAACDVSAYAVGTLSVPATPAPTPPAPTNPTPPPAPSPPTSGSGSGTVPCPLTHAGGADPNTSCWATHTGVQGSTGYTEAQIEANPAAVGFTKHNGDLTITAPNTVIDHEWIVGCISIADGANNTVIKNTLVTTTGDACSGDGAGGSGINTGQGPNIAKNTLIEDTTVDGGNPGYGSHNAGITLDGGEVLRVNLFGFAQGFISDSNTAAAPALFQDDYAHDFNGCSHDDGTWFNSSSYVTFEHGWVMTNDATQEGSAGCSTGALTGGSDYGPQDHVVFDDSYGEGVTGEDTHAGCGSTNSAYTNNALSNDTKDYGSGFQASDAGNSWAKNVIAETGKAVSAPDSGC